MIVRFLGTANAESSHARLVSLLIDGVLAIDAGSLTSGLSFAEQKRVRAILISHGHYDHIRDVPAFAFNNSHRITRVIAVPEALDILSSCLLNGTVYPRFAEKTSFLKKPALELLPLEPFQSTEVQGYHVLAVPVNHPVPAVGFEITSRDGKRVFYTGDTGPGLSACWQRVSPDLLIADLTFPNSLRQTALDSGHLCPDLLKAELIEFRRAKGYLPRIALVHLSPSLRREISREMQQVGQELGLAFTIATDGEELTI